MPRETTRAEKQTLIEQGTEFKGTMKSTCPVVVNGRLEGELTAPELDVTASGVVQGIIKADRLSSRGTLSGSIEAGDLFLSGSISSKTVIKAKNLEVKLSPDQGRMEITIGECTLDVGDEPTKSRRVEGSLRPGSGASATQLPVTHSDVPPPGKDDKLPAPTSVAPTSAKEGADAAAKSNRNSTSTALAIAKPPAPKKTSDSVPPPPG
jgi:cytoskeletal protein CcmA (bactofilin family)